MSLGLSQRSSQTLFTHHRRRCRLELEKHVSQRDAAVKDQLGEWQERLHQAKHREESMSKELKDLRCSSSFPKNLAVAQLCS